MPAPPFAADRVGTASIRCSDGVKFVPFQVSREPEPIRLDEIEFDRTSSADEQDSVSVTMHEKQYAEYEYDAVATYRR
jgi:hypothetical protein